ncbi:c-type cytochrome [Paraliomyxa miuraensis]|uniref:c-type cytochrome n=1 Tax=Paraliomyxa miuraensis TaxID=376150 RepID=UPI002258706C|nr:cytochrome c [Paraliomyxa miuraensis]MCX4247437.1 cytochrome c [Paraliomyxa miuraensis]
MRRLLILTLPFVLTTVACEGDEGDGGDDNGSILDLTGDSASGEALFASKGCAQASCHGTDGNSGATAPALSGVVSSRSDDEIIDAVLDGKGTMPPNNLSDQEMADVLAWLRETF